MEPVVLTFPLSVAPSGGAGLTLTAVVEDHDRVSIAFAGELDMSNASQFTAAVEAHTASLPQPRVFIDLGGVRLVDSMGINALLRCRRRAREQDRELAVVNVRPNVRRVLEITGDLGLLAAPPRSIERSA
jgi:anti-anti-sigma factor